MEIGVAEVVGATYFSGEDGGLGYFKYAEYDYKTVLSIYRRIYKVEGVVTANPSSGLYKSASLPVGRSAIGDDTFSDPNEILYDYLGFKVAAYVRETLSGDYEVIYAEAHREVEIIKFATENVAAVTGNCTIFEYYPENDSTKTRKNTVSPSAALLYNGVVWSDYTAADFMCPNGEVSLIDNDRDGRADVIRLNVYDTLIVSAVSVGSSIITGEFSYAGCLNRLDLEAYKNDGGRVAIYMDGKRVSIGDIQAGDVLSVFASRESGRKRAEIFVSKNKMNAVAGEYRKEEKELLLGDVIYKISDAYYKANAKGEVFAQSITVGSYYTFYLDINNKIAGVRSERSTLQYGYLKQVGEGQSSLDTTLKLRVFSADGEWEMLDVSSKLELNGESVKASEVRAKIDAAAGGVIGYSLNRSGEVSRLELPLAYESGMSAARLNTTGVQSHAFRYATTSFDCNYYMTGDTKVIFVPSDAEYLSDESLYDVGNNYSFTSNATVSYIGYGRDEYCFLDVALVTRSSTEVQRVGNTNYLVRKISTISDENGQTTQVTVSSNAYLGISFAAKDSSVLQGVKKGDIIKIHINAEGYIDKFEHTYKINDRNIKEMGSNLNAHATVKGQLLKVDPANSRILIASAREVALKVPSISVLFYDGERAGVSLGNIGDITVGDYVIADIYETRVLGLFVIRDFD